jgi:hypothetical protein
MNEHLGVTPQQARAWLDQYGDTLPRAQRKRYEALAAGDPPSGDETEDTLSRLLGHLHRGGAYSYWWTAEGRRSHWWPVGEPSPLPTGRLNIYFGVHPVTEIPPANAQGEEKPPHAVRSQLGYIAAINCLFAEFDAKDFGDSKEATLAHIRRLPIAPSVIIDSGGGYHCYWLLVEPFVLDDDEARSRADRLQKAWVELVGGDNGARDLARVLRVPGTRNFKADYAPEFPPVTIVEADFERLYHLEDLEAQAGPGMVERPCAPSIPVPPSNGGHDAYAQAALEDELATLATTPDGNRNNQLNKAAFNLGQFIGAGRLDRTQVEERLATYAEIIGLDADPECGPDGIAATISSGIEAGMRKPRWAELGSNGRGGDTSSLRRTRSASTGDVPALPAYAHLDEDMGTEAAPWLDAYIAFSQKWSPRAYDGFHEACGLWLLSTVAARRVVLHLGSRRYTPLMIALAAWTSLYAKTTTVRIATETLNVVRLDWLLAADASSPQKFIQDLTCRLPDGYDEMRPDQQAWYRQRLAFAGQRGWFYDEFGQLLHSMNRRDGPMAEFRGLIRRFDDCADRYEYGTISRGTEVVERPYLALLANMTPADLTSQARRGSSMRGDGFWARFAFVTPPCNERKRGRFPQGERVIPLEILDPLRAWHQHLGIPNARVEVLETSSSSTQVVNSADSISAPCTLGEGVYDAFYRYQEALLDIAETHDNHDLDGNYARFPEKALRVAMLLASLENDGGIELRHWARAQAIAERWRVNLHVLYQQVNESSPYQAVPVEDRVLDVVERLKEPTAREVAQMIHRLSPYQATQCLDKLAEQGVLVAKDTGRTVRYAFPTEEKV